MENITEQYLKLFGELPKIPIMCSYSQIWDLMQDSIISKKPLDQNEVNEYFKNIDEAYDVEL